LEFQLVQNQQKRVALVRRAGNILIDDVPFVPLYKRDEESRMEDAAVEGPRLGYENCVSPVATCLSRE